MRHELKCLLAFTVILAIVSSFALAAVPGEFHVQGRLTDASNVVVPDGDYSITFSIWDDPTAGAMLSSQTMLVSTSDGLFSVTLSVAVDIFHTPTPGSRYLQYQILGQLPIQPRTLLTATPYSMISSRVSGDIETGEGLLKLRRGTISSANFRMASDDDADQFVVEAKPDSTKVAIRRHASGDPDFDLLRIQASTGTGTTASSSIHLTGDPDFDLLRMSATPDSAKIRISAQSSGDPDFDLLRIVGGSTGSSSGATFAIGGDPDFDLLRIQGGTGTGTPASSSIHLTGDPDFDLLRLTASPDSAKIRISGQSSGDPDFDLLRIVGGSTGSSSGATFAIGGDPDFDLLRITGGIDNSGGTPVSSSSISMGGDPDFDLLRISAAKDTAKVRLGGLGGDPDFDLLRIVGGGGSSHLQMQSEPAGPIATKHSLDATCDNSGAQLRLRIVPTSQTTGRATAHVDEVSSSFTLATGDVAGDEIKISADNTGKSLSIGSPFFLDATRSNDDEVVKTFIWKQTSGPLALRMEMRADSLSSSMLCRGLRGRDVLLITDQNSAMIQIEDSSDNIMMQMHGEGRLGVGKPADNVKRIDVAGGAFCDGSNWVNASDVNSKENFSPVDAEILLDKIAQLDITEWNYRGESAQARHIGPTAQDFNRIFGVGSDNISISTIDPAGISLAAIKELYKKSKEVDQLRLQLELLTRLVQLLQEQINKK